MKIEIKKYHKIWEWNIINEHGKHTAGGYSRTKKDAKNDSAIELRKALATRPNAADQPQPQRDQKHEY